MTDNPRFRMAAANEHHGPVFSAIEKNTFKDCSRLTDISLPSSVTYIGESAFENCTNMRTVIIWGDITRIEKNAFRNCSALDDISIPSSCEVVEESALLSL